MPEMRSPLRSVKPRCSSRWRAWLRSPWNNSSSVSSAKMSSASKSKPTWVPSHFEYLKCAIGRLPGPVGGPGPGGVFVEPLRQMQAFENELGTGRQHSRRLAARHPRHLHDRLSQRRELAQAVDKTG